MLPRIGGYQPNIAARRLRGGYGADELQVAIFWAQDFRASMAARFMEGLREQVDSQNRKIRLVIYPYQNGRLKEARSLFSASGCHAAIIGNASAGDEYLRMYRTCKRQPRSHQQPAAPIREGKSPDCIFCGSSMTAHGVLRALWENQIPVPETVKIVAVGNGLDEDDLCTIPSLSVVQIQMEKVAAECMKLLLSLISDGASEPITRVIPVLYVPRESCGPLCRAF